jgi:hypothetical protein
MQQMDSELAVLGAARGLMTLNTGGSSIGTMEKTAKNGNLFVLSVKENSVE